MKLRCVNLRPASKAAAESARKRQCPPKELNPEVRASAATAEGAFLDSIGRESMKHLDPFRVQTPQKTEAAKLPPLPSAAVIAEAKKAIKACTDMKQNLADRYEDGDQSLVRSRADEERLRAVRQTGMDFHVTAMSSFARACYQGSLASVEGALALARQSGKKALKRLVSRREFMLRFTPLHICVCGSQRVVPNPHSEHVAVARALLEASAPVDARDVAGYSVLHLAVDHNKPASIAIAAMLSEYGANPNIRDRFGCSPLIEAVMGRQIDSVQVLLEMGADPNCEVATRREPSPCTPITLAQIFPDALQLFDLASSNNEDKPIFTCAAADCDNDATSVCKACRRAWYCSPECQKRDWHANTSEGRVAHKHACRRAHSELTRVKVRYDTTRVQGIRASRTAKLRKVKASAISATAAAALVTHKRFHRGSCHIVKLQLPSGGSHVMIGYDRLGKCYFELRLDDNPEAYGTISEAIRTRGVVGAKGYFNAWGRDDSGELIDIDVRCMMPPRPW
mmetsp:Transcript_11636/g.15372  ORF Transcript_11636/g.15372 Transcript_11636/m.15372 type:complete len:510 (-) Transcript_11636:663-2192(-)